MIQAQHTHALEEVGKIRSFEPEQLREIARTFADNCQQATYQFVQCGPGTMTYPPQYHLRVYDQSWWNYTLQTVAAPAVLAISKSVWQS